MPSFGFNLMVISVIKIKKNITCVSHKTTVSSFILSGNLSSSQFSK